jgi:DNA-binding NarL/FixJ family response regulator
MVTRTAPAPVAEPSEHVRDVLAGRASDPDLVDRIFELLLEMCPEIPRDRVPELKQATREEFGGTDNYVPKRSPTERQRQVQYVLRHFNGRNATEIARRLEKSRAWVYRVLKQPGKPEGTT